MARGFLPADSRRRATAAVVPFLVGGVLIVQAPDVSPHTEHFAQVNGVRLHYLDWGGSGDTLVWITGFGQTAHTFDAIAPRFTKRFRVAAVTRRGRAPSDQPATGYDLSTLTSDVTGFVNALGRGRVHLVGASVGGLEITEFARLYPGRVLSLVYLDAAAYPADAYRVMKEDPLGIPPSRPGSPSAQIDEWWNTYSPDYSVVKAPSLAFYALQNHHPYVPPDASAETRRTADEYWRTKARALVRRMAERFEREAANARVVLLEDASHHLYQDRENTVVAQMEAFYARLAR